MKGNDAGLATATGVLAAVMVVAVATATLLATDLPEDLACRMGTTVRSVTSQTSRPPAACERDAGGAVATAPASGLTARLDASENDPVIDPPVDGGLSAADLDPLQPAPSSVRDVLRDLPTVPDRLLMVVGVDAHLPDDAPADAHLALTTTPAAVAQGAARWAPSPDPTPQTDAGVIAYGVVSDALDAAFGPTADPPAGECVPPLVVLRGPRVGAFVEATRSARAHLLMGADSPEMMSSELAHELGHAVDLCDRDDVRRDDDPIPEFVAESFAVTLARATPGVRRNWDQYGYPDDFCSTDEDVRLRDGSLLEPQYRLGMPMVGAFEDVADTLGGDGSDDGTAAWWRDLQAGLAALPPADPVEGVRQWGQVFRATARERGATAAAIDQALDQRHWSAFLTEECPPDAVPDPPPDETDDETAADADADEPSSGRAPLVPPVAAGDPPVPPARVAAAVGTASAVIALGVVGVATTAEDDDPEPGAPTDPQERVRQQISEAVAASGPALSAEQQRQVEAIVAALVG